MKIEDKYAIDVRKGDVLAINNNYFSDGWKVTDIKSFLKPYYPFKEITIERNGKRMVMKFHVEDAVSVFAKPKRSQKIKEQIVIFTRHNAKSVFEDWLHSALWVLIPSALVTWTLAAYILFGK